MRLLALAFSLVCLASNIAAQNTGQGGRKIAIAVTEFKSAGGMSPAEMATLTNRFRGMLVLTKAFNVIEREKMNEVLAEQDFTLTDNCNTAECAVEVGQLLGVEQMIAGDIGKVGETFTIDFRVIDVTTAKIVKTQSLNYKGKIDGLIDVMTDIAYGFAGMKNPNPTKTATYGEQKSNPWPYILGGTAVAGGAAYFLLFKKGSGADAIKAPDLPSNP